MCIRLFEFVHFYPHRFIYPHQRADKINSYVAQKMYAFPIADGDATCRMCSKEEQVRRPRGLTPVILYKYVLMGVGRLISVLVN